MNNRAVAIKCIYEIKDKEIKKEQQEQSSITLYTIHFICM